MSSIDLRLLRYFIAVAEEGHLTNAAQRIGIQQPPLSQQIRALETELGVKLFNRLPRGMELTDSGQALLKDARAILSQVETTVAGVRRIATGESGRLVVGFTESASLHPFVPSVIQAFRRTVPDVALTVEESSTTELIALMHQKRLDVAFIRSPVGDATGIVIETMIEEEMLLAVPAGHRLARHQRRKNERDNDSRTRRHRVVLADLAEEAFILNRRPSGPGLYDTIIAACRAAGFSPRVEQEVRKNLSTLSLVAAGLGISIIPASMRHVELESVTYLHIDDAPGLTAPLHLAYRDDNPSGAVQRFIDAARHCVRARYPF